jgi:hypothetical protein
MKRWIGALVVAAAVVVLAWRWTEHSGAGETRLAIPGERVPYAVEVVNGTDVDGLARDITRLLRHQGIDVVSFGSASGGAVDSTLVQVRRGDTAAGLVVRKALGLGRVVFAPDSTLLVDVTVRLGRDAAARDGNP